MHTYPAIYTANTKEGKTIRHTVMARGDTLNEAFVELACYLRRQYGFTNIVVVARS